MTAILVAAFGLAWWLGLYLVARDPRKPILRRAGGGLVGYALVLAAEGLAMAVRGEAERRLHELSVGLGFLPALAWIGALLLLLPEGAGWRGRLDRVWRVAAAAFAAVLVPLGAAGLLAEDRSGIRLLLGAVVVLPLLGALAMVLWHRRALRPAGLAGFVAVATLLFGLGLTMLLPTQGVIAREAVIGAVGVDLALLGLAVAAFDAFDEGETLRGDMVRSVLAAAAVGTLFGGQVAIAMLLGARPSPALVGLLFGTVGAAVAVQVLANPLQTALDRLAFTGTPRLSQARAELRSAADALPRRDDTSELAAVEEAEFVRLTRRALSHYGDLGRLVSSPLTKLPTIDKRLAARGAEDQPLERAAELKELLLESIVRLKPRDGDFGTTDEWRYYNALYFSYVVGIRPYRRQTGAEGLDPVGRQALAWFTRHVPERTMHNWQNAAARLVATDLRGRL